MIQPSLVDQITDGLDPFESILFFLGLPLLFNSVLGFVIVLPLIILLLIRIPIEENMLIKEFGEEYREYMKRTKKLIPSVY